MPSPSPASTEAEERQEVSPAARPDVIPDWLGWLLVTLLAVAPLASWLTAIDLPLGDSHEGRILARFGLHVRNFWENGALASGLATDMSPYPAASNYAHHPPLINAGHLVVSGLFGQGVVQLRSVGYAAGIGTLFAGAALLRTLRIRWVPILLALAAMVATPMFWIYGRLGGGFSLVLALAAVLVALRERPHPPGWLVWLGAGLGLATAMLSWPAALTAALLGLWVWRRRGFDRTVLILAASMVTGVLLTVGWILQATDLTELLGQAEARSTDLTFTATEWLSRQWRWLSALLPAWYLLLLVPALIVGVMLPKTRFLVGAMLSVTVVWAVALPEGSYIHDFWNLSLLAPGLVGMAALAEEVERRLQPRLVGVLSTVGAGLLAVAFWAIVTGPWGPVYFQAPSDAGALLERTLPPVGQAFGWVLDPIPAPRWVSWYWQLPVRQLEAELAPELTEDSLVLVRTDRLPAWVEATSLGPFVDQEGRYALVTAGELRQSLVAP